MKLSIGKHPNRIKKKMKDRSEHPDYKVLEAKFDVQEGVSEIWRKETMRFDKNVIEEII